MASLLFAYQAIARWEIPITTGNNREITLTAFLPGEVRGNVDAGSVPRRILFPPGEQVQGVSSFKALSFRSSEVTWVFTDLLIYQMVGLNEHIGPLYTTLTNYCDAYAQQVTNHRVPAQGFTIVDINFRTGVFNFPQRSQNQYNGAAVDLYIKTVIC